jgi:hypothetical protein
VTLLAASSKKLLGINMGIYWQYGNRILEWNNPPFKGNPLGISFIWMFMWMFICMFLSFISFQPLHRIAPFEGPGHWHRCSNHAQLSGLGAGVFCDLC